MDATAWREQVEAAVETGDRSMLQVLAGIAPPPGDPLTDLLRCRMQAALGQVDAAARGFPDLSAVEADPRLHRAWAVTAVDLARRGVIPNHWGLGRALTRLATAATERDAEADALDILEQHVHAALARGAVAVARRGVELYRLVHDAEGKLAAGISKRRMRAAQKVGDDLARAVAAAPDADVALPDGPADVHALLGADPEADIATLGAALQRWPASVPLLEALAHAWTALDDEAAGIDAFRQAVLDRPADDRDDYAELAAAFGWHLLRGEQLALLDDWVQGHMLAHPSTDVQARGHWLLARARLDRAATGAARASVQRMLALQPDSLPGRQLLAGILRTEGDLAGALALLDAIATEYPGDTTGEWHWDRMEVATLLPRWDSVRDSAARLGMPLSPGDAPIDEAWSACRVHMAWATGDSRVQPAIRTGPVTARVIGLDAPDTVQRYGDVVLIRARPMGDEAHPAGPLFEALQRLSAGNYTVAAFDGQDPGEEALQALGRRLDALGLALQWWVLPTRGPNGETVHVRVGLPPGVDEGSIAPALAEVEAALQAG